MTDQVQRPSHLGDSTVTPRMLVITGWALIWSLSLGSGTSGGVLAPVFMIGGALGGHVLPHVFPGFWAMMGLAAVVGRVMRSPLTGVVFTLELTHAWNTVLPLLIASCTAYALSTLVLKRSVLTEKIARRGLHLTREYSTDPLETFFAADVMTTSTAESHRVPNGRCVHDDDTLRHIANVFAEHGITNAAVVSRDDSTYLGTISLSDLLHARVHDLTE
ncbi:MAG TPA: chloride channel protein, partial [Jatrophihabitantaceae bacterium]|nr:chloride channel protein [Jatrophihabitantaceae bacterium]